MFMHAVIGIAEPITQENTHSQSLLQDIDGTNKENLFVNIKT